MMHQKPSISLYVCVRDVLLSASTKVLSQLQTHLEESTSLRPQTFSMSSKACVVESDSYFSLLLEGHREAEKFLRILFPFGWNVVSFWAIKSSPVGWIFHVCIFMNSSFRLQKYFRLSNRIGSRCPSNNSSISLWVNGSFSFLVVKLLASVLCLAFFTVAHNKIGRGGWGWKLHNSAFIDPFPCNTHKQGEEKFRIRIYDKSRAGKLSRGTERDSKWDCGKTATKPGAKGMCVQ